MMEGGLMAFSLPVGPQHLIYPEAALIKIEVESEQVLDADIDARA